MPAWSLSGSKAICACTPLPAVLGAFPLCMCVVSAVLGFQAEQRSGGVLFCKSCNRCLFKTDIITIIGHIARHIARYITCHNTRELVVSVHDQFVNRGWFSFWC